MDCKRLSELYDYRASEANLHGLGQKAGEYWEISRLLWFEGVRTEQGRLPLDLNVLLSYRPFLPSDIMFSIPRRFPGQGVWEWLTAEENWESSFVPSFPWFFKELWAYVGYFFLWVLSPWFHIRVRFIKAFINLNNSKLLDENMTSGFVRNRKRDLAYYRLKFHGFRYTLDRTRLVGKDGLGTSSLLSGEDEELEEVRERVCSGWVFGWKSFVREIRKIEALTPDLEWRRELV